MPVDLRSDTLSQPTPGMLEAMSNARVGDDVFGEDPTVNLLEQQAASLFGMEAALYCTSGTQSNQIAIKAHTQPGEEVVCEKTSHIYLYEAGGIAFHSGCQVKLLEGDRGRIRAEQIADAINPDDVHKLNCCNAHYHLQCLSKQITYPVRGVVDSGKCIHCRQPFDMTAKEVEVFGALINNDI